MERLLSRVVWVGCFERAVKLRIVARCRTLWVECLGDVCAVRLRGCRCRATLEWWDTGAQPTSQRIKNVPLSQNTAVYSERSGSPQRQAEGGMLAGIMESRSHYWQGTLGAMAMASALAPAEERA